MDGIEQRKKELARRVNLLIDALVKDDERATIYRDISAALKEDGLSMSRVRWGYLLSGDGYLVSDDALLAGIARYFEVDPTYLTTWGEAPLPDRVEKQLDLVKAMREQRITAFAARTYGRELSKDAVEKITEILRQDFES
ncbi:hypothetical protein GCM10010988_41240 [Cnuibacter physcomitrellae]|uniref:Uncharacterized protein n=1 Tax=Cnuibacter physcomitrellae TaxID=1619308 RepID=A0A1X9LTW7_9MICO|nr:hypothetical protein [Cnuibacter physcomitrellae]ARJ07768.1 hypothetical protein B5808_20465 [Cnuibacter physcomitrellae]GGI42878.1 hypothetical protein GCM10010988_41240 [Cnuibacter physcomitrellae]